MPLEEQNGPGFHYFVKWRRQDEMMGNSPDEFQVKQVPADTNVIIIEDQPVYTAYEIYVLARNDIGEAVAPPKIHVGYSAEDGNLSSWYVVVQ